MSLRDDAFYSKLIQISSHYNPRFPYKRKNAVRPIQFHLIECRAYIIAIHLGAFPSGVWHLFPSNRLASARLYKYGVRRFGMGRVQRADKGSSLRSLARAILRIRLRPATGKTCVSHFQSRVNQARRWRWWRDTAPSSSPLEIPVNVARATPRMSSACATSPGLG